MYINLSSIVLSLKIPGRHTTLRNMTKYDFMNFESRNSVYFIRDEFYKNRIEFPLQKSGILRDKTMTDRFMYIPNDDKQNLPFCRLDYWLSSLEAIPYKYPKFLLL